MFCQKRWFHCFFYFGNKMSFMSKLLYSQLKPMLLLLYKSMSK